MDLGLSGRRAVVAASTRGLGFGCAAALARNDVDVVVSGRSIEGTREAASRIGPRATPLASDVSTPDGAEQFIRDAQAAVGDIDILVLNGPGPTAGRSDAFDISDYRRAVDANLLSVVAMVQAALPSMVARGWGRILAITSLSVRQPLPDLALSNTARTGATGYLKTVALEVARSGVTVNSLHPGLHRTQRVAQVYPDVDAAAKETPLGMLGDPSDFGEIAAFLCSEQARYITGASLAVDGGVHAGLY